jgi:tetratricopeptide (TPR) repeat protein
MPALLRLTLAVVTLTTFWLALFVSDVVNSAPVAEVAVATADVSTTSESTSLAAAEADAALIDGLLVESREAFSGGRWQEALEPTRAIVARFPGQPVYLSRLAEIYNKLERPSDEAATWELFLDRAPLPAEACPAIGYAYRRIGKHDLALSAFERCFQSDTTNPELAFFVGLGNEWLTRFSPAEEYYDRAIAIATSHLDSEVGLARLRLHRNQLAEALSRARTVLTKSPKHVDALLVAGLAEQRAGHRAEARIHLERAAALSDDYFDVHLALGVLDYSESRFAEARQRFELANQLDPKRSDEVRVWLERTAAVRVAS